MSTNRDNLSSLALAATLFLFVGLLAVLAGFVIQCVGRPDLRPQNVMPFLVSMYGGAACIAVGIVLSRLWYAKQKPHTD